MTATTIAAQFAHTLGQHGFTATLHPAPTPNGYGHKIALATPEGMALGHLVIYAGKQGPRYVTNELRSVNPLQQAAIATAWTTCGYPVTHTTTPDSAAATIHSATSTDIELWVDGACLHESGTLRFGWAYVIRRGQTLLHQASGCSIPENAISHRNVAAEIQAVIQGLQHCRDFDYSPVTVCYDYEGLEAWATGRWNTNTPVTAAYQRGISNLPLSITWKKIPAHTGVPMNELVDSLAHRAAALSSTRHPLPINAGISPPATPVPNLPAPRTLTCCCCGGSTLGRQWWNRDTGYGLCDTCAQELPTRGTTPEEMHQLYGKAGIHYLLPTHTDSERFS